MFTLSSSITGSLPLSAVHIGGLSSAITAKVAEAILPILASTQAGGMDPYGAGWQRVKRGGKPLHGPTGTLLANTKILASGREVKVNNITHYAVFHQRGGARLPQRKIVPDGWPVIWERSAHKAAEQYFKHLLR